MRRMNPIELLATILVIVGAINWGLVGAFDYNLVDALFGVGTTIARIIYVAVGVSGLLLIFSLLSGPARED